MTWQMLKQIQFMFVSSFISSLLPKLVLLKSRFGGHRPPFQQGSPLDETISLTIRIEQIIYIHEYTYKHAQTAHKAICITPVSVAET